VIVTVPLGTNQSGLLDSGAGIVELPFLANQYLEAWINRDSWSSASPLDMESFYQFVKAVEKYGKTSLTKDDLKQIIIDNQKGNVHEDSLNSLEDRAADFARLYEQLREFSTTPFPNPLIEQRDIVACFFKLRQDCRDKPEDVESGMKQLWGDDWKNKLKGL